MKIVTVRLVLACASVSAACLFILTLSGGMAAAESADGTWTQRTSGEGFVQDTWPADWHYDVTLKLSGGSGTWWMKVVKVTNVQPGQESARSTVGNTFSYSVTYTTTSTGINLRMEGKTLALKISGGRMTGSGSYDPGDGSTIRWTVDLVGGSGMGALGDMGTVAAASAGVAVVGSIAGMAAAAAPAPRPVPRGPVQSFQQPQPRPNPQHGPYERWVPQRPQVFHGPTQQQGYTVAPGDAREMVPEPFVPVGPDPALTQSLGGVGITQGPPDTPPPPTPPNGGETQNDPNPHCQRCGAKTLPLRTNIGWRWHCRSCNWLPWG